MENTWLFGLAMTMGVAATQPAAAQRMALKVELRNDAQAGDATLGAARQITTQIYAHAGIEVLWANDDAQFTIVLKSHLSQEITRRIQDAIGFAPGTDSERGRIAFVILNRVNEVAAGYGTRPSTVLGAAIAHELGHLLLFKGHTTSGLMRRYWNQSDFRNVRNGQLLFTSEQGTLIRSRLSRLP
jgi:hypothetical protein